MSLHNFINIIFKHLQIHKEWLQRRSADKENKEFSILDASHPVQKIQHLRKLIKFKTDERPIENQELSFVPHFESSESPITIPDTKFSYETVNSKSNEDASISKIALLPPTNLENLETVEQETTTYSSTNPTVILTNPTTLTPDQEQTTQIPTTDASPENPSGHLDEKNKEESDSGNVEKPQKEFNSQDYDIKRFISDIENNLKNNVTVKKSWGKWGSWSGCSRSCGEGVKMQARECTEKV